MRHMISGFLKKPVVKPLFLIYPQCFIAKQPFFWMKITKCSRNPTYEQLVIRMPKTSTVKSGT